MFGRFSRGWELVKQSWAVLKQDKELMLFPVLSSIACLLVIASFISPFFIAQDTIGAWAAKATDPNRAETIDKVIGVALLFSFYFLNYFVIVFFNTALASCAIIRFKGENPTLADGMRAAFSRFPQILAWAFVAATVGLILRLLEQRFEALGRFIIALIGTAWSIVTYLVIPVIAVEKTGPVTALRRSASLVTQTWGESLAGNLSMGLMHFVFSIPGFLLIVGGVSMGTNLDSTALMVGMISLGVLYLIALSILFMTLQQVFLSGVYVYAAEGQVPNGFSEDSLQSTFRSKG